MFNVWGERMAGIDLLIIIGPITAVVCFFWIANKLHKKRRRSRSSEGYYIAGADTGSGSGGGDSCNVSDAGGNCGGGDSGGGGSD